MDDILPRVVLYHQSVHDVVSVDCSPPETLAIEDYESFYWTLSQALIAGLQIHMNVDVDELKTFLAPNPEDQQRFNIVLYETAEGGSGILEALQRKEAWHAVAYTAREMLHEFQPLEEQCERACYDCLCNYYNQPVHDQFARKLVLPILAQLEFAEIGRLKTEDRKEHYKELMRLCESEFEKRVLVEIGKRDLRLPTSAQKTIYSADEPIARTDFYYERHLVALFVDGPSHDKEPTRTVDKVKRERLEAMGYRVFVIRYDEKLGERIANLAEWVR